MQDGWFPPFGPPTLMTIAEHDPLTVQTCTGLDERFPYIRTRFIPGEGHLVVKKRDVFLPILRDFWATLD